MLSGNFSPRNFSLVAWFPSCRATLGEKAGSHPRQWWAGDFRRRDAGAKEERRRPPRSHDSNWNLGKAFLPVTMARERPGAGLLDDRGVEEKHHTGGAFRWHHRAGGVPGLVGLVHATGQPRARCSSAVHGLTTFMVVEFNSHRVTESYDSPRRHRTASARSYIGDVLRRGNLRSSSDCLICFASTHLVQYQWSLPAQIAGGRCLQLV